MMPYKYAVECVCDKLAATRVYAGANYDVTMPLAHWEKYGNKAPGNPRTMKFMYRVFCDVRDNGEAFVLNEDYMRRTYKEICG
jgi:hypothetical protein